MTRKVNALVPVALAALGLALTAGTHAVAETLLDQYTVKALAIAQVNDLGNCIVIATVNTGAVGAVDQVRAVCDGKGDVKLYGSIGACENVIKASKMIESSEVTIKRKLKESTVGDPITSLKTKYKAFKKEAASSLALQTALQNKITAAIADGWDTSVGTPEAAEYAYFVDALPSIREVKDWDDAKVVSIGAALTTAGVDPATVL